MEQISKDYLVDMYLGEERRDATPKVRGFLYQDLVAIEILINSLINEKEDISLALEVAEDIYIQRSDEVEIIQVKYYPSSKINYDEIYRELFYQFLKLKELGYEKNIKCKLIYHTVNKNEKIDHKSDIKKHIKVENEARKSIGKEFLEEVIQDGNDKKRIKVERENYMFKKTKSKKLNDFTESYVDCYKENKISKYREELQEKISELLEKEELTNDNLDEVTIASICLSVAIAYIQETYNEELTDVEKRKRNSMDLWYEFEKILGADNESEQISHLVSSYIDEALDEVLENLGKANKLKKNEDKYVKIAASTEEFFKKYLSDKNNYKALLNTIACKKIPRKISIIRIAEHKEKFIPFLYNIWKILFNLDCERFDEYLNIEENRYLEFKFPEVQDGVVVMGEISLSSPYNDLQNIRMRYKKLEEKKPRYWFLRTNHKAVGRKNYNIDIGEITEEFENDTSYLYDNDIYILECMECIKLETHYGIKENCKNCIFDNSMCVKGKWK